MSALIHVLVFIIGLIMALNGSYRLVCMLDDELDNGPNVDKFAFFDPAHTLAWILVLVGILMMYLSSK